MSEQTQGNALVTQILEGKAPERLRSAAARGALPLPRVLLAQLFVHLRKDESEDIRAAAEQSLADLDPPALEEILGDPSCTPEVLAHFATQGARNEELAERIAFHPAVPVSALAVLAATGKTAVVELVLTNQERLLAHPELLERLTGNPVLRADQRGRILEMLDRAAKAALKKSTGEGGDSAEDESGEAILHAAEVADLLQVDVGELLARSEIIDAEEFAESEDPIIRDAYARIMTLNTASKAILAMKGGREERRILVRDSNRIVSMGVLKNPRITDSEVAAIAAMRNIHGEVLRQLGSNREWTKTIKVAKTLVLNPRTPPSTSANFVHRMSNRDLTMMKTNHEVPELIRLMSRRLLEKRLRPVKGFKR